MSRRKASAFACAAGAVLIACAQGMGAEALRNTPGPLASVVKPYMDSHEIEGAVVLAADRNHILDCETIGYADIADKQTMTPGTIFWIASMTKAMTASAVMMLVDEGKVHLDDPVEKYLPEFKNQKVQIVSQQQSNAAEPRTAALSKDKVISGKPVPSEHPITIREILSHTAGLPFRSKQEPESEPLDRLPLRSAVDSYAKEPLNSQPGHVWDYSNEGFNIAGRIIEVVSGIPYQEFMQKRLFTPLAMKDTTFWPTAKQLQRLAKSYESPTLREVPIDQLSYPLSDRAYRFPIPAGGLFSTADDIARFCQMLLNGGAFHGKRYLSAKSVQIMTTKETPRMVSKPYGFGFNVGDGFFEHSGAYKTDMKVDEKRGLIVVFLVQHANDWALDERQKLMNALEQAAIAEQH